MPTLLEGAALEAIKPAGGFINALLGPKIEKIKRWSSERELHGKIEPENLSKGMNEYLIKLSHRVSEITSIAFPQLKLDIFKSYEPLSIGNLNHNASKHEKIKIESILKGSIKSSLIVDSAGMGKTTFSKFLVTEILFKSDRIPIFFELRKIDKQFDLIENIAKELDFPGRKFDRELFYKLIQLGKFFVIADGFDEVEIEHQVKIANQINELSMKGGENILLITTRPQEILPDLVHGKLLKFMPFSLVQTKSLIKRYDAISTLDIGSRLEKELHKVPAKFIESPLLASLLYRTFGINNSIAEKITTFYDEIYTALYKGHDLINKNGFGREKKSKLDFEDFRKLIRSLSYFMMLNRKTSFSNWSEATQFIEKASEICSIAPSSSSNFLDDLLVAVPLMLKEGNELKFFHKTILEYFCAEHITYTNQRTNTLSKILQSKLCQSFAQTFSFIYEINHSLFESEISLPLAEKAKNFYKPNNFFEEILYTLIFIRDCKIGLWNKKDHSEILKGHNIETFRERVYAGENFNSARWHHVKIGRTEYFFVLKYTRFKHDVNALAWKSLCEEKHFEKIPFNEKVNIDKEIVAALGKDKWNDINEDLIKRINNSVIMSLASKSIGSDERYIGEDTNVLVMSPPNIDAILDRAKFNIEILGELDLLLKA